MFDEFDEDKDFNQNLSIYRQFLIRSLVNLKTGQLFGMTINIIESATNAHVWGIFTTAGTCSIKITCYI